MWFNHDEPLAWLKARGYSHAVCVAFLKNDHTLIMDYPVFLDQFLIQLFLYT